MSTQDLPKPMTEPDQEPVDMSQDVVDHVTMADAVPDAGTDAPDPESLPVVFDVEDLSVYYRDYRAVRDVDLKVRRHEITAFIGPSGCGKTTVLRCFNRMNDLIDGARVEGTLNYHGVEPLRPRRRTRSRCGAASAWCSRSPTRSPSRSTTTSPTGPASAA